jgi:hypothetical protein
LTPAPAHWADPAPKVGDETPTLGLDRNELGALLALNGLRISEAHADAAERRPLMIPAGGAWL